MAKSRYMADVEEALARELECSKEVARLQEEAFRLEKAMENKQKKIVKNNAKITELNNKGARVCSFLVSSIGSGDLRSRALRIPVDCHIKSCRGSEREG